MIDKNDPKLTAFVLDELSAEERAQVQAAIDASDELAAEVEAIRAAKSMLEDVFAAEAGLSLSDEQKAVVESASEAGHVNKQSETMVPGKASRRRWVSLAVAAGLAAVLIGGAIYQATVHNEEGIAVAQVKLSPEETRELARNEEYTALPLRSSESGENQLAANESEGISQADFGELIDLIQTTVGDEIEPFPPELKLVITQSQSVTDELRDSSWLDSGLPMQADGRVEDSRSMTGKDGLFDQVQGGATVAGMGMGMGMGMGGKSMGMGGMGGQDVGGLLGGGKGENGRGRGYGYQGRYATPGLLPSTGGVELTLSETIASHDRRTQDLSVPDAEEWNANKSRREKFTGIRLAQQNGVEDRGSENGVADLPGDGQNMSRLQRRLLELQASKDSLRTRLGPGHPEAGRVGSRIRFRQEQIAEASKSTADDKDSEELRKALETRHQKLTKLVEAANALQKLENKLGKGHPDFIAALAKLDAMAKEAGLGKKAADPKPAAKDEPKSKPKPKSWKRVKAIPNTTRLMVGDKQELDLGGMQVNVRVDGFRARVLIDYFYYNDRDRQLEGNFKLRLPDDSSLYYFAFGESAYDLSPEGRLAKEEFANGKVQFVSLGPRQIANDRKHKWTGVKESRMVPREKAAHAYRETVRRRVDPALVEWSGAGVFNARIFPLAPKKLHRIVVGYDTQLVQTENGLAYELALPERTGDCKVELNVRQFEGMKCNVTTAPREKDASTASGIEADRWKQFEFDDETLPGGSSIRLTLEGAARALLQASDEEGDFWATRVLPQLESESVSGSSKAVFLVDTSLSSSPEKFNVWLKLLEQTLTNNRDSIEQFAVVFFDVDSHFWKEQWMPNTAENVASLKQTTESLALEGATNLYRAIETVASAKWISEGNGEAGADVFLLSDGAATWGETNLRLIDRMLQKPSLGSLFAYQTGLSGTSVRSLRFLAGQSGGAVFSVASDDEIANASTAHRQRPWLLKSISGEGASDVLTAGRVQWVYPGQAITVVGRGKPTGPLTLEFEQGGQTKAVRFEPTVIESDLASRMYGHVSVGQLESLGSEVFDVSTAYARHFRITGRTCSLLMLDSEEDYQRFKIKPEEDLFVVKSKAANEIVEGVLEKSAAKLADPKARLLARLARLESMPGMQFKTPTALKLAIEGMNIDAVSAPLGCKRTTGEGMSKEYFAAIAGQNIDYQAIEREAKNRGGSAAEAIKVWSNLVERNPGNIEIARDVAFTAMKLNRPAEAYYLLDRVARMRPFQGSIYPAMAQCLVDCGQADLAMVHYEVAMNGTFGRQGSKFRQIVAAEYSYLLRQVARGKLESGAKDFAEARLASLGKELPFGTADVVITMMWNRDQTDVDLHVTEPSGEECYYQHSTTQSDGRISDDITTGFGPEMYFNANAPRGKYKVEAKYYSQQQNRTSVRNRVYLTIFRALGTEAESVSREAIDLEKVGQKEPVLTLPVE